ncbi:hypothetical protein HPB51_018755 [Rhipicephalus microplus]|uniref:Uncharacterized protein n=1 Tax=Rhipicephalus microplus TaxID=6941 RepID=A0A9J6DIN6_RHIMP|nr:hypothetical protein HPB51_018755 [Rhipicephalus microplus]
MANIELSDFGPPNGWLILRQLLDAFGRPSERSVDGEADNDDGDDDDDASSYVPLLDEFLSRREGAAAELPPCPPAVNVEQDARPHHCRLIHGLCFEGGKEISLDILGPGYVNGYDSDSINSTDSSSANEAQAERSIHHQDSGHQPENDRAVNGPAVETRSDPRAAVRNQDGGDSTPSTALDSQYVAAAPEHFGGEGSSSDARPAETIFSVTRSAARCLPLVVGNVQSKVQRVCGALTSLLSRNRDTSAQVRAGFGGREASVYELECELHRSEHEPTSLPVCNESKHNQTGHANLGGEPGGEESSVHSVGPVLECVSDYYGGDLCSTEAFFPAALKSGQRLNNASEKQETRLNEVRISEATPPEHCACSPELSGSYFGNVCVTAASPAEIRDSSIELPGKVDLNVTDDVPTNEVTVENATNDVVTLNDMPQKAEENCCPVPLQVGSNHDEVWFASTFAPQKIFPAPTKDDHCSLESSGDRGGGDGADRAVTLLPRVRHDCGEQFREINLNSSTSMFTRQHDIENAHQSASDMERGLSVGEAPNAVIGPEHGSQALSRKSMHVQQASSHNDEKEKYRDALRTQAAFPASSKPGHRSAERCQLEYYTGAGCIVDSVPATRNSSTWLWHPVHLNCVVKKCETESDIDKAGGNIAVEEETYRDHDAQSPVTQPQNVSSLKHSSVTTHTGASNGDVSYDATPVMLECAESSKSKSMLENALTSALAVSLPGARDSCIAMTLEADPSSSEGRAELDQQIKGDDEDIPITEYAPADDAFVQTRTTLSPVTDLESQLVACVKVPSGVTEVSIPHDKAPIMTGVSELSGAISIYEGVLSSAACSLCSEALDSCLQILRGSDSNVSVDQQTKETSEVVTQYASQDNDSVSTETQNRTIPSPEGSSQSLHPHTRTPFYGLVEDVSLDKTPVVGDSTDTTGRACACANVLSSARSSLSGALKNCTEVFHGINDRVADMEEALVGEKPPEDTEPLNSSVGYQDMPTTMNNTETPLITCTQAQPDTSAKDTVSGTTPVTHTDTELWRSTGVRDNCTSAPPSLSIVPCSSGDQWNGETAKAVVTETTSKGKDASNLNADALPAPCVQAQPGVSEDDVPCYATPIIYKAIESGESDWTFKNNVCSHVQLIESHSADLRPSDENVSETSLIDLPRRETPSKATSQNSRDYQPPEESTHQTITRRPPDTTEHINTMSSLPMSDFCPSSHATSPASGRSLQPSTPSRSEGEIRSDDECDGTLLSGNFAEQEALGDGNVAHEYDPEDLSLIAHMSETSLSEGEIVDSVSDESTALPPLNEDETFGHERSVKASISATRCTSTYTEDEDKTSDTSSSSTLRPSPAPSSTFRRRCRMGSENDTVCRPFSPSLPGSPQRKIQDSRTAKAATICKKKTFCVENILTASARCDNNKNGSASRVDSASFLRYHKKDGAEDDGDISIPLLLNTRFKAKNAGKVAQFQPRFIQPASSANDQPDRPDDQESDFPASSASTLALRKVEQWKFEYYADMVIPLSLPVCQARSSVGDSVGSAHSPAGSSTSPPLAHSDVSCDKKSDSEPDSEPMLPLLPTTKLVPGEGEAGLDELPRPGKQNWRKKDWRTKNCRKQNCQTRRALYERPLGRSMSTASVMHWLSPEASGPPGRKKQASFVTEDPAENRDNEDPEWEPMRRLTCDEERYWAVSRVWHSRTAPEPQEDLTIFHYRRRRLGIVCLARPSCRRHRKRKASCDSERDSDEAKRRRLDTEIFDRKIEKAETDREREMEKAREKLDRGLREVREERRRREQRDHSSASSSRRSNRGCCNSSSRSRTYRSSSRRSQGRRNSSDSDCSSRIRRRRWSRSFQDERDSSTERCGKRRHPSKGTSDYSSSRHRSGRSRSFQDRPRSTSFSERGEGGHSTKSRGRERARRQRSESATDSRSRKSRLRSPGGGDSSPRRRQRGRRDFSESRRSRGLLRSEIDHSPSYRSRDRSEEGSWYWERRERMVRDDFEAERKEISSKYNADVDKLVAARREVSCFDDFYMDLTHTDPRMLSASNACDYDKLDAMLREMEKTYATATRR